ncbi:unnamed protein product [Brachionus calyciflorus]|uniref:Uncharacterized protein n=1 Tax=Brachionus calyciflorus TaxID=104777 RepID=A0A813MD89_9BILA|nr:unnamed protein product [Brachionus calyciflorus]
MMANNELWNDFIKRVQKFKEDELEFKELVNGTQFKKVDGMMENVAKFAEVNFSGRKLHELIRMNTEKFQSFLDFLGEYNIEMKKISHKRVERLRSSLIKRKIFLKKYAFDNFNIVYDDFDSILEIDEDLKLSQIDLKQYEVKLIKVDNSLSEKLKDSEETSQKKRKKDICNTKTRGSKVKKQLF